MDILFLCDLHIDRPWVRDRVEGLKYAINEMNLDIQLIDIYDFCGIEGRKIREHKNRNLRLINMDADKANKTIFKNVKDLNPKSIVFATADNFIDFLTYQTVEKIKKLGIYTVGFLGDDEFNNSQYRFLSGWFDMFVVYVKYYVDFYQSFANKKGYWLPNSCYLDSSKKIISKLPDIDCVFIGAPIADRVELLREISNSGFSLEIYGSKKWSYIKDLKDKYKGYVSTSEFDDVLSKSRFILCPLKDHIDGKLHMNTKIWEACRVNRLPLVTYYEPLIKDYLFKEGTEIVFFRNKKDLIEKMHFYKKYPEKAEKVLKNMLNKVHNEFDYSLLFKNLLIDIEKGYKNKYVKKGFKKLEKDLSYTYLFKNYFKNSILKEFDYVYTNYLYRGKIINQYWPFINLETIKIINNKNTFINKIFYILFKKGNYLKSLNYKTSNNSISAEINILIHQIVIITRLKYSKFILPILISLNIKK